MPRDLKYFYDLKFMCDADQNTERNRGGVVLPQVHRINHNTLAAIPKAGYDRAQHPSQEIELQSWRSAPADKITTVSNSDRLRRDRSLKASKTGATIPAKEDTRFPSSSIHSHTQQSDGPSAARQPVFYVATGGLGSGGQDKQGFSNPLFQEEPDQPNSRAVGFCQPAPGFPSAKARAPGGRNGGEEDIPHAGGSLGQAEPPPGQKPTAGNGNAQ